MSCADALPPRRKGREQLKVPIVTPKQTGREPHSGGRITPRFELDWLER